MATSLGWELGPDITVPLTTTDLTAQAAQIASAKPDVILSGLADSTSILLDRGLQANGSSAPVVASDAVTEVVANTTKDTNLYYVSTVSNGGTTGAGYQAYRYAVKAAAADPTKPFVDRGYIQGLIIIAALKGCNGCTGQALIDSLNKLSLDTQGFTAGPITFSATDHQGIHKLLAYHYDSSKNGVALFAQDLPVGS
jgi:ABC-type branched-subunit amino acid transport system substrate-binding protein